MWLVRNIIFKKIINQKCLIVYTRMILIIYTLDINKYRTIYYD
jgi:hypothetical protein